MNLGKLGAVIVLGAIIATGCSDGVAGPTGPTAPTAPNTPTGPTAPMIGSIVLELEADTLSVNETTQLQATVLSVDGDTLIGQGITFESSDDDIAVISDAGLVTAVGPGTARITARADNRSATIEITVLSAVGSVHLQPQSITATLADTVRTTVIVRDTSGAEIANPQVVYLCQSAPGPDPGRRYGCGFRLITLDSNSFTFGPGAYMEGIIEVVAQSGGVSSNTMHVFLAFGDPNNPWDY